MPKIKVLYAEDEPFLGKIVKESLESRGFDVYMESNGERVFERYAKIDPDVCVLDVMLPNKNGFEIAREIRSQNKDVPILFLTAKTQTEALIRGFTLGGNDYIRKPFSMEELIARIHNSCRHNSKQALPLLAETVSIGSYQFHQKKQVLAFGEEERKLSYRENELLKFLFEHRHAIISRRDIMNTLWGNDSFFNSRNLDVYISKLRNYLKYDGSLEIITIKGVGYRFVTG
jgi:DNA-binding response OmpR family regulator